MAGIAWNDDPVGHDKLIEANSRALLASLAADAAKRAIPGVALAHRWHKALFRGVAVPSPSYAGNPRDSDQRHPDLIGYEVVVGAKQGIPAASVPAALTTFQAAIRAAVNAYDESFAQGVTPSNSDAVLAIVELAAVTHGEWVRIHPYANGNGRVARIWANWAALRYGLPPFIRVKPRPKGIVYARAAMASMGSPPLFTGDHGPTVAAFVELLHSVPPPDNSLIGPRVQT